VTSDNSSVVTMTTASGSGTIGTATATAVNGVATFTNVGIAGTAGTSYLLTFAKSGLTSVTQNITPTAGVAKQLTVFTAAGSAASGAAFLTQPVIQVKDSVGNVRLTDLGRVITVSLSGGTATLSGTLTATTDGGAATFTNVGISGTAGTTYTLLYTSPGLTTASQGITPTAGAATQIAVNAGNGQSATVGTAVTTPPSVIVKDASNNPVSGVTVSWVGGGQTASFTSGTNTTDSNGIVSLVGWTLGSVAGTNTLTATVAGLTGSPLTFTATGTAGPATQIAINAGNSQSATVNTTVTTPPSVIVKDASNNPVSGVAVAFLPSGVSSKINGTAGQVNLTTNASGIAALSTWLLGTTTGTYTVNATSSGLTGSPVAFTATGTAEAAKTLVLTTSGAGAANGAAFTTQPVVTVKDSLGNVRTQDNGTVITVALSGGAATLSGTLTATTVNGVATFSTVAISGTAGTTYTLLYTASGLTTASQGITPTVGAAKQLAISTQATGNGSGAPFVNQPVIQIRDSGGNVVTTDNSTVVTMTVSSGATVIGTATATATSGVAAFSNVGLSGTSGSYTITFTSGSLTSTSQSVSIVVAF
jgi:hypothetical protein